MNRSSDFKIGLKYMNYREAVFFRIRWISVKDGRSAAGRVGTAGMHVSGVTSRNRHLKRLVMILTNLLLLIFVSYLIPSLLIQLEQ